MSAALEPEVRDGEAGAPAATDWVRHRRWFLTEHLRIVTRGEILSYLDEPADRIGFLVDLPDETPLGTLVDWALTDVAWLFADAVADLGDTRRFLLDVGELDPGDTASDRTRTLVDLRRLLALAAAAEAEDPTTGYFGETVTRLIAVLMGLHLSWPGRLTALGPALVSGLLELTDRWALRPMSLDAWSADGLAAGAAPVRVPDPALLVSRAACHLEQSYADFYDRLATEPRPAG